MRRSSARLALFAIVLMLAAAVTPANADTTAQTLPFSQDWTNIGLITASDNWSGVPGIEGYRGDNLTALTGTDPQTIVAGDDAPAPVLDVNANQTNPETFTTGGATEFHIANPVVALAGSGTADAPYLRLYLNTTGQTNVTVHYALRDIEDTDDTNMQVALQFRAGSSGNFTNVPAGYVSDATDANATLVTNVCAVLPVAAENQALVQVRIMTTNAPSNDEWVGVDNIVVDTLGCAVGDAAPSVSSTTPADNATGVALNANIDITFSEPVNVLTPFFTISCTSSGGHAAAQSGGPTTFTLNPAADFVAGETCTVTVDDVAVTDQDATDPPDTMAADHVFDFSTVLPLTPIHDIQGPSCFSPLSGPVSTTGIVTGVKSNGFFIQEPDASVDADPNTSEGILVFTGGAPPAAAAVGNLVQVTGTISEFVPSQDPRQPPLTELTAPTVTLLSSGNPLPAAIAINPDPLQPFDQLERFEGMRVSVATFVVTGPTLGSVNEPNATATSSGVFYGTILSFFPRPFREAGIPAPDDQPGTPLPPPFSCGTSPAISPIPRFDSNPERIRVDSDGLVGGGLVDVNTDAVITGLVGPLDYSFRTYTILPDPGAVLGIAGGKTPTSVTAPTNQELTVAAYNMERFFNATDDPGIGEPVLTPAAYDQRLNKASLAIRNNLQMPDILGVVEMENLATLQDLAARISSDAIAAAQPDPLYTAHLVEGNDIGGIDVGYLVKTQDVDPTAAVVPRVTVNAVVQELDGTLFVNPDASTETLNDRPPLRLDAVVNHTNGNSFPLTVIVNHLRSLNGVNDDGAGSNGWATAGARVRAKRLEQAEDLANLVQTRQTNNPAEHIVLVGDFNAFEVNDGLGDSMGVIDGTPVPDNETAVPGDGVDLVNPDLDNLFDSPPSAIDRYGYVFDGNAQNLDHALVNAALIADTSARRLEHPRINADFAQTVRNDGTTPARLSDHDPIVIFFELPTFPVELLEFSVE